MNIDTAALAVAAMETSDALVVVLDPRAQIVLFNKACARLTGYSEADVRGRVIWDVLIPPDETARLQAVFADLADAGAGPVVENDWMARDGTRRRVRWRNTVRRDRSGAIEWIIATGIDLTEQRAAEAASAARQANFDAVLKASPDGIVVTDETGVISAFSQGAERMFGYGAAEAIGQDVTVLMTQADAEAHPEHVRRYRQTGAARVIGRGREVLAKRKNGETFPVHIHVEEGRMGGIRFFTGALHDMSEQRQVEARLWEREHLLEAVFDAATEAVVVTDLDGGIVKWNSAFADRFGAPVGDRAHAPILSLCADPDAASDRWRGLTGAAGSAPARPVVLSWRDADGAVFPGQCLSAPVRGADGRAAGYVIRIRDVSEERRREDALRHAQRMESIGRLTGGMAHDFNNVLTVIKGNLEMIEDGRADGETRAMLAEAREAADMGAAVVAQMLAFARRQALMPQTLDANKLVLDMTELLRRTLGARIRLTTSFAPEPPWVRADPNQLKNAVLNLVLNARDAMPDGGVLAIETGRVDYAEPTPTADDGPAVGPYVAIAISDSGSGVAPEMADRLFEPYATTKAVGEGAGMGLSMVYGFVRQSGGHVTVDSREGQGATFTLLLPPADPPEPATAPARREDAPARPLGGREAILLVEDDDHVRAVTRRRLMSLGYHVEAAPDAARALEALASGAEIDLVLSDIVMPGALDGRALADQARRLRPGVRIVLMSGLADPAFIARQAAKPDFHFLPKPHSLAQLDAALRRALDG